MTTNTQLNIPKGDGVATHFLNGQGAYTSPAAASGYFDSIVVQVFTSIGSNTYTPTTGMKYCTIEVQAPGGGGGGVINATAGQNVVAGGGGGGGYARKTVTAATIGASQTVTIGAVGTAGANTGTNGGTGGTTSVGAIVSATGGGGGNGSVTSSASYNIAFGGLGGVGSSGDFNINGGTGGFGVGLTTGVYSFPIGGNAFFGGNTQFTSGSYGIGTNGVAYGAGGTGAASVTGVGAFAGGTGGPGIVIITEYIST